MIINLKGTGVELASELRNYLDKRLESVGKFLPEDGAACAADVELGRTTNHHHTGEVCRAEINLRIAGQNFRAVSVRENLHEAIDDMKDELVRELASYKEKRLSLLRRGGQKIKNIIRGFYPKNRP